MFTIIGNGCPETILYTSKKVIIVVYNFHFFFMIIKDANYYINPFHTHENIIIEHVYYV